jgi:hypothetical protein
MIGGEEPRLEQSPPTLSLMMVPDTEESWYTHGPSIPVPLFEIVLAVMAKSPPLLSTATELPESVESVILADPFVSVSTATALPDKVELVTVALAPVGGSALTAVALFVIVLSTTVILPAYPATIGVPPLPSIVRFPSVSDPRDAPRVGPFRVVVFVDPETDPWIVSSALRPGLRAETSMEAVKEPGPTSIVAGCVGVPGCDAA